METDGGGTGSGRCVTCALACGVCKIICFTCSRRLCGCCFPPPPVHRPEYAVLCVGLGGSGKSSILAAMAGESMLDIQPTMGFAIKAVVTTRAILTIKELGGGEKIRPYWDRYFSGHQAIIFVVDSTASDNELSETQVKLEKCLEDSELAGLPLLLLCNKQDIAGARSIDQLKEKLQLDYVLGERVFVVQGASVQDVESLKNSFEMLIDLILKDKP